MWIALWFEDLKAWTYCKLVRLILLVIKFRKRMVMWSCNHWLFRTSWKICINSGSSWHQLRSHCVPVTFCCCACKRINCRRLSTYFYHRQGNFCSLLLSEFFLACASNKKCPTRTTFLQTLQGPLFELIQQKEFLAHMVSPWPSG